MQHNTISMQLSHYHMADLAAYPGGVQSKPIHSLKLLLELGEGEGGTLAAHNPTEISYIIFTVNRGGLLPL